jgi:hypothetical protein
VTVVEVVSVPGPVQVVETDTATVTVTTAAVYEVVAGSVSGPQGPPGPPGSTIEGTARRFEEPAMSPTTEMVVVHSYGSNAVAAWFVESTGTRYAATVEPAVEGVSDRVYVARPMVGMFVLIF